MEYREAYEHEHLKCIELAARNADLETRNQELERKLNRITNHPFWKLSKPFRVCMHWVARQRDRVVSWDIYRKVIQKRKHKKWERAVGRKYGIGSFPSPRQIKIERDTVFPRMVKISILVPLWNNSRKFQIEMLDSVMNQTYVNWELCLADGSDKKHSYIEKICRKYVKKSRGRIIYRRLKKNDGISGNTNACLQMATGEYIGLLDQDDILHPSALYEYVKAINERGADYVYCDEITFQNGSINKMLTMHFKPDYAPDNLRANNYICHFSVFARELLDGNELFRSQFDGSQDHDMILRLTDNAKRIVHVPRAMYYWRSHAGSVASDIGAKPYVVEAAKGAVAENLRKHGYAHFSIESTRALGTFFRISYQIIGTPRISVVIVNKDHAEELRRCVSSILEKSTYKNYEIIIVENFSTTDGIREYYGELQRHEKISVVINKEEFNSSTVHNLGVSHTTGEYVLLLSNATEVITANWMEELLMYAQRRDVGAVGAKLYYEDGTIRHAGMVIGLGPDGTAGCTHHKQDGQDVGYMGRLCYAQNVTAVTGACLLIKKSLYLEVGGLEEAFAISLSDVDLCLKLRRKGLLNVFTPFAELYCYESVSGDLDDAREWNAERYNQEIENFREKWKSELEAGDPYYNPNLSLDKTDFRLKMEKL